MTEHDARTTLAQAVTTLPAAELCVLAYVAEGLLTGVAKFGPLHAGKRRWLAEAAEESRDRVVYELADVMERAGLLPTMAAVGAPVRSGGHSGAGNPPNTVAFECLPLSTGLYGRFGIGDYVRWQDHDKVRRGYVALGEQSDGLLVLRSHFTGSQYRVGEEQITFDHDGAKVPEAIGEFAIGNEVVELLDRYPVRGRIVELRPDGTIVVKVHHGSFRRFRPEALRLVA